MTQKSFLQTATLVTVFSICERALGFLYRIILSRTLGSEGVGLYQLTLSVFAVFVTLVSSGIPITVSRLIAKYKTKRNIRAERQTVTAAVIVTLACSVPLFFALYLGHGWLDYLFSDERCAPIFLIMLFGFVFNSVYAVLRGSFWGNRQFLAYSVIEFIEESVMIVVGSLLVVGMTDILDGTKRAAYAVVLSYLTSFTIATIYFFVKGGKFVNPRGQFKPLLSASVPITAMRTSTSLVNSFIGILLPARLIAAGMTQAKAMAEYGVALGMAVPVLYTPATIIGSIALVLTPELSENFYGGRHEKLRNNLEKTLKATCLIACTMMPLFFVFGQDMGMILFSSGRSGEIIHLACVMLLPMSLNMISSSMLNSLGCEKQTLLYYFSGSAVMLLCVWFLPQYMGVYALIFGQLLNHIVCALLNLLLLRRKCKYPPQYGKFLVLALTVAFSESVCGSLLYPVLQNVIGLFPAIFLTAIAMLGIQLLFSLPTGILRQFIRLIPDKKVPTSA